MTPGNKINLHGIIRLVRDGLAPEVARAAMREMLTLYDATNAERTEFFDELELAIKEFSSSRKLDV